MHHQREGKCGRGQANPDKKQGGERPQAEIEVVFSVEDLGGGAWADTGTSAQVRRRSVLLAEEMRA